MFQAEIIEQTLLDIAEKYPDKSVNEIITAVVEKLQVPRPTVRRVKHKLLTRWSNYAEILKE